MPTDGLAAFSNHQGVAVPHKAYMKLLTQWTRCRDCYDGQDAVKAKQSAYLPPLDSHKEQGQIRRYEAYLMRALFYNAFGRTVIGLAGFVMQKPPNIREGDKALDEDLKDVTQAGEGFEAFSLEALQEILITGRYGILVDIPQAVTADGEPVVNQGARPYWSAYRATDIISWKTERRGVDPSVLTRVVLREEKDLQDPRNELKVDLSPTYLENLEEAVPQHDLIPPGVVAWVIGKAAQRRIANRAGRSGEINTLGHPHRHLVERALVLTRNAGRKVFIRTDAGGVDAVVRLVVREPDLDVVGPDGEVEPVPFIIQPQILDIRKRQIERGGLQLHPVKPVINHGPVHRGPTAVGNITGLGVVERHHAEGKTPVHITVRRIQDWEVYALVETLLNAHILRHNEIGRGPILIQIELEVRAKVAVGATAGSVHEELPLECIGQRVGGVERIDVTSAVVASTGNDVAQTVHRVLGHVKGLNLTGYVAHVPRQRKDILVLPVDGAVTLPDRIIALRRITRHQVHRRIGRTGPVLHPDRLERRLVAHVPIRMATAIRIGRVGAVEIEVVAQHGPETTVHYGPNARAASRPSRRPAR